MSLNVRNCLAILLATMAASCTDKGNQSASEQVRSGATLSQSEDGVPPMPIAPRDAEFTIYCSVITGPDHIERSKQYRIDLVRATKLKDFYIVHGENQTIVYYGFYRTIDDKPESQDPAEGKRAKSDLHLIFALHDNTGNHPFANCLLVPRDAPDPASRPEWDLMQAAGYWSVEIGVYTGSVERKQKAVEAVGEARAGGIEAYFCHTDTTSGVYVGAWPQAAVKQVGKDPTGEPLYEPSDPTLIEVMRQFPEHSINGLVKTKKMIDPATHQMVDVPDKSFLVRIPRRKPNPFSDPPLVLAPEVKPGVVNPSKPNSSPMPRLVAPTADQPSKPAPVVKPDAGRGKLKSIGD